VKKGKESGRTLQKNGKGGERTKLKKGKEEDIER
jgi:hypothetical protein